MKPQIPWLRFLVEGVVIVGSILLAFGIEAWWDDRGEERIREVTVEGLLDDFESNQTFLSALRLFEQRVETGNAVLIAALDGADHGEEVVVPDSLLVAAVSAPVFSAARATLDAMLATGRLGLIRNHDLRESLAAWLQALDRAGGHEVAVRQIVIEQVVPLLARQTSLAEVHEKVSTWSARSEGGEFASTDHTLRADSEVVGVLAHRKYRTGFVLRGQATLLALQEQIIAGLHAELGR